jgi:hypothetical protein
VTLNFEQEAAFYHGEPSLVSQFFTSGMTSKNLGKTFNVRVVREPTIILLSLIVMPDENYN